MDLRRGLFALLMGGIVATFVNGYLLDDGFALQSRSAIAVTALAAGLGAGIALFLYPWVGRQWQGLASAQRWKLFGSSLLLGSLLFFGGTSRWLEGSRYLRFLLPVHHLQLSVSASSPGSVKVVWFTTALGDISFKGIERGGWQRKEDVLVLTSPNENSLEWRGKVGEWVKIVFESEEKARVVLSWDGHDEMIELRRGDYIYRRSFPVPLLANSLVLVGWPPMVIFTAIALLWVWLHRTSWLERSMEELQSNPSYASWEGFLLFGIIIFALLLRAWNLEVPTAVDELRHTIAAREVLERGGLPTYQRSFWTVTIPVAFAFRILGFHIWAARIPGIIFNVLALIPFYLLGRRINRPVAILASLLYATSPFLIAFARMIREYAYYPFYFSWIAYGMLIFLERLPSRFSIWNDGKRLLQSKTIILGLSLLLPIGYAIYDASSTFKLIFISYLVLAFLLFPRLDYKDKTNRILLIIAVLIGLGMAGWLLPGMLSGFRLTFNPIFLSFFFADATPQWYFQRSAILAVLVLSVNLYFALWGRGKYTPLIFLSLNYLFYLAFLLLVDKPSRPLRLRHMSGTEIWFILLIAAGSWLLWRLIRTYKTRTFSWLLMIVLLPLSFNIAHVSAITVSQDGLAQIGEDFIPDESKLHEFMVAHADGRDILIASTYRFYVLWTRQPNFKALYPISITTSLQEVTSIIQTHPSGWIAVDRTRINQLTFDPFQAFASLGLEYMGTFGENQDEYLWHWQREK